MRKRYIFLIGLAALLATPFVKPVFDSNFDRFAKETIRQQGHRSGMPAATDTIRNFVTVNQITDPIAYFERAMGRPNVLIAGDPSLSDTDLVWLGDAERLSSFHRTYFNYLLTSYNFGVQVYDHADGSQSLTARPDPDHSPCASARLLPDTARASVAPIKPSKSPSRTPLVSDVSYCVRKSFTIW